MGAHHFKLGLVPKEYFVRAGCQLPSKLADEDIERGENTTHGWWASRQPSSETLVRLRQLCPNEKSWGETEEFITSEPWGSDVRIWKERDRIWLVTFRYSPIVDDHSLLDQFLAIARNEHCLLLDTDTGSLFEPADAIVSEHLRVSQAMRFTREPQGTILEGARNTLQ